MKKLFVACMLLLCGVAMGQSRFDYSDIRSGKFDVRRVTGIRSMADGEHYTVLEKGNIVRFSYQTGLVVDTIFAASHHSELKGLSDYALSYSERKILLTTDKNYIYRRSYTARHWVYDIDRKILSPLTDSAREQVACFSPDATKVAFVRDNNIWLVDLSDFSLRQVTTDGERNRVINGHTDWVYEEEFGFTRAFEFSPDGTQIAFLRLDESEVPEFTMMRFGDRLYPEPYTYKYPKAGERNSKVVVMVYDIAGQALRIVDMDSLSYEYIPRIGWTPSNELYMYRTNRLQNRFDLVLCGDDNQLKTIYSEENPRYIEHLTDKTVTFLPDGKRFVVMNESSGFAHLYLYDIKRGVVGAITSGDWEVTNLVGIVGQKVYYLSCEGSPLRRNLYSISLTGKDKRRLTSREGTYSVAPSSGMRYFISNFSNVSTAPVVTLHDASGKEIRTLEENRELTMKIKELEIPIKEFFTFITPQGTTLNGYMIKPRDFDPSLKYPVLMSQYSGPGSQEVADKWSLGWTDVLVQKGYVVVSVDGRGTGLRGEEFRKCTYQNLGALEVEDQIYAARYLSSLPWVDPMRIGIYGWSYGGFMALNCILKGNDVFRMAIAVAPVTSWRFYDSIYTEIYNGLPQDNPEGYDHNSPIHFADSLRGKLLIVHGTSDDNVHVQNTYAMVDALIKADKHFDLMLYPDNNHSMYPSGRHHIMDQMIEYTLGNL